MIEEEYVFRQKQKERIAENKRLNPNNYDYQDLPVISMATMGGQYMPQSKSYSRKSLHCRPTSPLLYYKFYGKRRV